MENRIEVSLLGLTAQQLGTQKYSKISEFNPNMTMMKKMQQEQLRRVITVNVLHIH